jgi:hypothetical protein
MTCELIRGQLPMLLYGELSFDEEEAVESHLEACPECRAALERERELTAVFDQVAVEPSPALLRACREGLAERLKLEAAPAAAPAQRQVGWWDRFVDTLTMPMQMLRPAGAVALIAVGFLGARLVPANLSGIGSMSLTGEGASRVRSVEPGADGRIHIVLDETRQRSVDGNVNDAAIRELLLAATKDPSDDGLRAETVTLLTRDARSADVRDALVYAVRNDQNAGVRLKALEGLKAFTSEADVRGALADVLASDSNQAMRIRAIDLLVESLNASKEPTADRRLIGVLQELLTREKEPEYLRQLCQRVLDMMNASSEVY